jgi:nitroreductase
VEFEEVVRRRRMVRAFAPDPVPAELIDELLDLARRAPSAGNTRSVEFLVLEGAEQTSRYWAVTLPESERADFAWPDLPDAPVIVVVWVDPDAYVARYREPDKTGTGLGTDTSAWPVPYWWVDGGAAVMTLLHGVVDRGLGALFFGLFEHEAAVRSRFGVPPGRRAVGAVALGRPTVDRPSASSRRPRPALERIIHRGHWGSVPSNPIREAYLAVLGGGDPAAPFLTGAVDLRPQTEPIPVSGVVVTSGPEDLRELRQALEQVTGTGTWPFETRDPAATDLRLRGTLSLSSKAPLLELVSALEDEVVDRTGAWRTWPTVVASVASLLGPPLTLTVDAVVSGELGQELVDRRDG